MFHNAFRHLGKATVLALLAVLMVLAAVDESQAIHKKGQKPRPALKIKPGLPIPPPSKCSFFGAVLAPNPGGGVLVVSVKPGSPADQLGLEPGDVILSVNGTRVNTPEQLCQAIEDAIRRGQLIVFQVIDVRTGTTRTVTLPAASGALKKHR